MAMLNNQRVYEVRVHKGIWKRQLMKNPMTWDEMGKNKETLRGSGMVLAMFSRQDLELNREGRNQEKVNKKTETWNLNTDIADEFGGFHKWGNPNSRIVYFIKSPMKMDEN